MTALERALLRALREHIRECPPDLTWPPAEVAHTNACDLLWGKVDPETYLRMTEDIRQEA